MKKYWFISSKKTKIQFGPDRVFQLLQLEKHQVDIHFVEIEIKSNSWKQLSKAIEEKVRDLPPQDSLIFNNAYEAWEVMKKHPNRNSIVFLNDDSKILARQNIWKSIRKYGFKKAFSWLNGYYLEKKVIKKSQALICCSHYLKQEYECLFPHIKGRFKVLYPGVDPVFYTLPEKEIKDKITLGVIKTNLQRANVDQLITVLHEFNMHEHVNLVIVGQTNQKVQTAINSYRGKITHYQYANIHQLGEIYQFIDSIVVLSQDEAFGIVVLEAMAANRIVITHNVGGIKEAFGSSENVCLLSRPHYFIDVIDILKGIITNKKGLSTMKDSARHHVEQFTSTNLAYQFDQLLINLN